LPYELLGYNSGCLLHTLQAFGALLPAALITTHSFLAAAAHAQMSTLQALDTLQLSNPDFATDMKTKGTNAQVSALGASCLALI
jgi:hypothetical protein